MILSKGVEKNEEGTVVKYNFFADEIFGIENSIEELMSYLRAAASGSEVGKRILLMYGPTSSGKSQISILLKKGLEEYTKTDEGAVYGGLCRRFTCPSRGFDRSLPFLRREL